MQRESGTVLLSGATGFVGRHLYPLLVARGHAVRCATRRPDVAARSQPEREWVALDLEREETLPVALAGCRAAFFLVHQMTRPGYAEREQAGALSFAREARRAGLQRLVYLGGIEPSSRLSPHLESRLHTGRILAEGGVPLVELRASMILGAGSASWRILRDLSARLPAMLLPSWVQSRSQPVAIDDVVSALAGALELSGEQCGSYDLPGPEILTVEQMLRRTAALLGRRPLLVPLPWLTPRLSSYWVRWVTRSDLFLVQQLVEGLRSDILARDSRYWALCGHEPLIGFEEAARRALREEDQELSLETKLLEGLAGLVTPRRRTR